ncbi:vp24 capsid [Spodoptera litura granulovirus]|uniref:Vp24 capsid n=1 Tax=Spodoptera litura granulovirus TaxID=359919 RepID=A5IZR2_9BBAC|nr:vp24 capsid [Spodoptera litura granulovirus]ABQ52003.1 vp24 capsid [Spodoptera litura granulovirus]
MSSDNSNPIEVFVVTNDDGKINGYAEINSVVQLLSPYTRLSSSQLWNSTQSTYRIQNNGKSFVHAFVLCKYLASIPESDSPSYKTLRQLVHDLLSPEPDNLIVEEFKETLESIHKKLDDYNSSVLGDIRALLNVFRSELVEELKGRNDKIDGNEIKEDLITI